MTKKKYNIEDIVAKLRQVDGPHNQGSTIADDPPDWRERSDVLSLAKGRWRHED